MTTTETIPGEVERALSHSVATGGIIASAAALISAAACCVLPILFVSLGLGASTLSFLVPYHWPLTILAGTAITLAWLLFLRARARGGVRRSTATFLAVSTILFALSVTWEPVFEAPLKAWLSR
jgi:mercuric ion transport protein